MKTNKKANNNAEIPATTLVMDTDQLGFHFDIIKCTCGHIQQAKVIHTSPEHTHIHECEACHEIIEAADWNSQITI